MAPWARFLHMPQFAYLSDVGNSSTYHIMLVGLGNLIHENLVENLSKLGIDCTVLRLIKCIYEKRMGSLIFNGERTNTFPLRSGKRQG